MSKGQETQGRQEEFQAKTGLEILYARCEAKDRLADVAQRDVPRELRERYWIRQAGYIMLFPNRQIGRWALPSVQATLVARHLRGDLPAYPPFVMP